MNSKAQKEDGIPSLHQQKKRDSNNIIVGENNMQIVTQGDVATDGSTIDKRSGGYYFGGESSLRTQRSVRNQSASVGLIVLGVILAVIIGLGTNLAAAYLQENYNLITDAQRFLAVVRHLQLNI